MRSQQASLSGWDAGDSDEHERIFDSELGTTTEFEQLISTGKHSPTAYLTGRCKTERFRGCRFWMMLADNKTEDEGGTPDVIGFLVFDGNGKRVAYGTGPVVQEDIEVAATPY